MLAYFDQSARFCVHKQTNTQTNKMLGGAFTPCAALMFGFEFVREVVCDSPGSKLEFP